MIKKLWILLVGLLLCSSPAWGTTYYLRADGTAANLTASTGPCTAQGSCGDFDDLEAGSPTGDDVIILCDDGGQFRDRLDIPTSGTDGHPITYQGESGGTPAINGSDLVSTWTESSSEETLWNQDLNADSGSPWAYDNMRQVIPASVIPSNATQIRIQLEAHSSFPSTIYGASICEKSGATRNCTGVPTRITWDTENNGCTVSAGSTKWSDWISFNIDETKDYLIHLYRDTGDRIRYLASGNTCYYVNSASDETLEINLSGSDSNSNANVVQTLEGRTGNPNVWEATLNTDPTQVFFNSTRGTEETGTCPDDLNSDGEWCWDSNTLYQHSTSDPDTRYTSPGTEATLRDCIALNNDDYIAIEGLTLTKGIYGIDSINGSAGLEVTDVITNWHSYDGIIISGDGADATLVDIIANDNYRHGADFANSADFGSILRGIFYNQTSQYGCGVAISGGATNVVVDGAEAYNNWYGLKAAGSGTTGHTFKNSNAHDNESFGIDSDTGCTGVIVDNNDVLNNGSHGIAIEASNNNVVKNNRVRSNGASSNGIMINGSANAKVYGNIVYNEYAGIYFYGSTGGLAYNNTVYNCSSQSLIWFSASTTGTAKNNIIDANTGNVMYVSADSQSGFTSDWNEFGGTTGTVFNWGGTAYNFSGWKTNSSQDANSLDSDPEMVDPTNTIFGLKSSSPCVDFAVNLGSPYDIDMFGRDQDDYGTGWECGALVYLGMSAPKWHVIKRRRIH